jgi:hypothetical protein
MMGGVSPETCWAIKKHWNDKFYYMSAACWFFLWDLYYDARIHKHQDIQSIVVMRNCLPSIFTFFGRKYTPRETPGHGHSYSHKIVALHGWSGTFTTSLKKSHAECSANVSRLRPTLLDIWKLWILSSNTFIPTSAYTTQRNEIE